MKSFFTLLVGLAATLPYLTGAQTLDGDSCPVDGEDDGYVSVVGVQGTGVHPRMEIRDLEKDKVTWNLFVQAMARFQAMDQSDKLSYFQVAAIHGAPFGPWDGVEAEGDDMMGYCPHVSNLFGTWHRPYLALFEQALQKKAVEIADEFPEGENKKRYQDAADRLRMPYWDWAIDPPNSEGVIPLSMRRPQTVVTLPNGVNKTIPNPLAQYTFHPLNHSDFAPLSRFQFMNWNTTIRYPLDGYSPNATSRNDELNVRFAAQQINNRDILYKLLTVYQPFNQWSNKANGGKIGNIETLHDGIHNSFGLGHIGIVEVSAFDPAFWFHHANMDRVVAIYQHRYPNTYVEDSPQAKSTFYYKKNSTHGVGSELKPFHMNAEGDFWTSVTVRNWETFGYTYPELKGNPDNATLTRSINHLYKPKIQGLNKNDTISTRANKNETADAIDWMAEINLPSDIQTTYAVRVFLGKPDVNASNWPTDKNYVGQIASLASPRSDSDIIITANVVLTDRLAEKYKNGELKSLKKESVEEWLKDNFHWRIQASDLTEIPRKNPPKGLNVTVVSVPIHLPESENEVPVWPGGTGSFDYKPEVQAPPPEYPSNTTKPENGGGKWNGSSWDANATPVTHIRTVEVTVVVPAPTAVN